MFAEVLGDVREDRHLKDEFMTMRKGQPGALIREKHGIFPNYVPSPFQNMLFPAKVFLLKISDKKLSLYPYKHSDGRNFNFTTMIYNGKQQLMMIDEGQLPQY